MKDQRDNSTTEREEDAIVAAYAHVLATCWRNDDNGSPDTYDSFLELILRDLEEELDTRIEQGSLSFKNTQARLRRTYTQALKSVPQNIKELAALRIVMNNRSGTRKRLFDAMLGEGSVTTEDYKPEDDFEPRCPPRTQESRALVLMITALQKSLSYLRHSHERNVIVISEITRMFSRDGRLGKAPGTLSWEDFSQHFSHPDPAGLEVITAVSMVNSGWFLGEPVFEELATELDNVDAKGIKGATLQGYLRKHKLTDSKDRLLHRTSVDATSQLATALRDEPLTLRRPDNVSRIKAVVGDKLSEIMSRDLHDFRIGFGKAYLHLRNKNEPLTDQDWQLLREILAAEPLRYANLLDLPRTAGWGTVMENDFSSEQRKMLHQHVDSMTRGERSLLTEEEKATLSDQICRHAWNLQNHNLTVMDILNNYHSWGKYESRTAGIAIQERDLFVCVDRVEGNPFTIVGLPVEVVFRFFHDFHVEMSIPDISLQFWPSPIEQGKIIEEDTMPLLGRKEDEDRVRGTIRELEAEERDMEAKENAGDWSVDWGRRRLRHKFRIIQLARRIWSVPDLELHCGDLYQLCRPGDKQPPEGAAILKELLTMANCLRDGLSCSCSLQTRHRAEDSIDRIGSILDEARDKESGANDCSIHQGTGCDEGDSHSFHGPKRSDERRLEFPPRYVKGLLDSKARCLALNADRRLPQVRDSLYWNDNQLVIEEGIVAFRDYLHELKPKLCPALSFDEADTGISDLASELLHDAFTMAIEANLDIQQKMTEHVREFLVNDWEYFSDDINRIGRQRLSDGGGPVPTIFIALGNNGKETMAGLWQALLFLVKGWRVTLAAKSRPMMIYDCHIRTLWFVIPYFDYLVKTILMRQKGLADYLGKELTILGDSWDERVDCLDQLKTYIKNHANEQSPPQVFILTGERWYTQLVGEDDFNSPPYNPWPETLVYTLHAHKNRYKPLALMNDRIFSDKGEFVYRHVTTGWYAAQLFRPLVPDDADRGWKRYEVTYRLKVPQSFRSSASLLDNLKKNEQDRENGGTIRRQILAECRAYAGLPELTRDLVLSSDSNDRKRVFYYKSPHKHVSVTITESEISVLVLIEYEDARIQRTGGTEWPKLKKKIPTLIRSIFAGIIYRRLTSEQHSVDPFDIGIHKVTENGESTDDEKEYWKKLREHTSISGGIVDRRITRIGETNRDRFDVTLPLSPPSDGSDHDNEKYLYARVTYRDTYHEVYQESNDMRKQSQVHYVTELLPATRINGGVRIVGRLPKSTDLEFLIDGMVSVGIDSKQNRLTEWVPEKAGGGDRDWNYYFHRTEDSNRDRFLEEYANAKQNRTPLKDVTDVGVMLAPMDHITHRMTRVTLNRKLKLYDYGDRIVAHTEMIRIGGLFLDTHRFVPNYWEDPNFISGLPRMAVSSAEGPLIYQLAGPHNLPIEATEEAEGFSNWSPEELTPARNDSIARRFAAGAMLAEYMGAAAIDINMGCFPLYSQGGGIKLAEEGQELAAIIVKTVKQVVSKDMKVSAKTRLLQEHRQGTTSASIPKSLSFYGKLIDAGVDWITVHTRLMEDGQGFLNDRTARNKRHALKEVIDKLRHNGSQGLPIIGNGEIVEPKDFDEIRDIGCCAAMVGLGVYRDATILTRGRAIMTGGQDMEKAKPYRLKPEATDTAKRNEEYLNLIADVIRGHNCGVCTRRSRCIGLPDSKRCKENAERVMDGTMDEAYLQSRLGESQKEAFDAIIENLKQEMQTDGLGRQSPGHTKRVRRGYGVTFSSTAGPRGASCPPD